MAALYICGVDNLVVKIDGGEVRVLNDDEVISTIKNPRDILHHY